MSSAAVCVPSMNRFAPARLLGYPVELAVFVVAFAARLVQVVAGGGFHGNYGYDAAVYFAAGDAFSHGRLPYRDFVLLHPPALMIVMTPFALLARLTTDEKGFIAANVAFTALGALNAVLTARVARRMGLGALGAAVAGGVYALWYGSIQAEYSARLEPLGNFFLLSAFLAMLHARRADDDARGRWILLCGAALGASASSKIWWGLPLVVVLAWLVLIAPRAARIKTALLGLGGALAAFVVIDGVFFVLAPSVMLHELVLDQLDRPKQPPTVAGRLGELVNVHRYASGATADAVLVLIGLLVALACVVACRVADARVMVALTVLELAVLLDSPHWSGYYGDFLTPSLALTIAAATYTWRPQVRTVRSGAVGAALAAAAVVMAGVTFTSHAVVPFPGRQLAGSVRHVHCVMADSPMALIELNALSRDLSHGCLDWPDVSGRTYSVDAVRRPGGTFYSRPTNVKWQRDIVHYLRSGQAVILIRPVTGLSYDSRQTVIRDGRLKCAKGHCVYRVLPTP